VNTLTVCRFGDPATAERALPPLRELADRGELVIDDAALVAWPRGARKPSTRSLGSLSGPGELWGGFWGVLLGLIFLVPLAGPVFGAAAAAFAGTLADFGIDDDYVLRVRELVTPGTSALFAIGDRESADRLVAALGGEPTILRCTLTPEHERKLRSALGEETGAV
jgi:uncharacterized membrane protein